MPLKIHHLNCGTLCPKAARLLPQVFPEKLICHCLLVEANNRLILIDTGLGEQDLKSPLRRLGLTALALGVQNTPKEAAIHQIRKLGFAPKDVSDVIVTHLDIDHAGGIADFPSAKVHVSESELRATESRSPRLRARYNSLRLENTAAWKTFKPGSGEKWQGFDCVRELDGLPPEILAVDLPGHTPGHYGVAINTEGDNWTLHVGDAYYDSNALRHRPDSEPEGLKYFQMFSHIDYPLALQTQGRLAQLKLNQNIHLLCSHDPKDFPQK